MALTPVNYDPFAKGRRLTPVNYDPFARGSSLPRGKFGSGIEMAALAADPNLQVTGRGRTPERNRQVGGVANSAHLTDNARDFVPRKGETLKQAESRLNKEFAGKGYKVIEEGSGARHSTGPHLHVEATGDSKSVLTPVDYDPFAPKKLTPVDYDPFKSPQSASPKPRINGTLTAKKPAQRPGNQAAGGDLSLGETFRQAGRNFGSSLKGVGEGLLHTATHPWELATGLAHTAEDVASPIAGGIERGFEKATGTKLKQQKDIGEFEKAIDPAGIYSRTKKAFAKDPVGTVLSKIPLGGSAKGLKAMGAAERATRMSLIGKAFSAAKSPVKAARAVRSAISPTRASPAAREVGQAMRTFHGVQGAAADRIGHRVGKLARRIDNSTDEEKGEFLKFIETRSQGGADPKRPGVYLGEGHTATGEEYDLARKLRLNKQDVRAANDIRDAYAHWHKEASRAIYNNTGRTIGFVRDYFTHMWEQSPDQVESRIGQYFSTKQGTHRYFLGRHIPTIEEGIAAGLTPKYGIMQTVQVYSENMANLVATHDAQAFIKDNGHGGWFKPGEQPEGWVKADGILAERAPPRGKGGRPPKAKTPEARMLGTGPGQKLLPDYSGQSRELAGRGWPYNDGGMTPRLGGGDPRLGGPGEPLQIEGAGLKSANPPPEPEAPPKPADRPVNKQVFFMKPEVARLYNNSISKPFNPAEGPGQALGHGLYHAGINSMLWKFALSGYHVTTMALESAVSGVAKGMQDISRGKVGSGVKSIGTAPFKPITSVVKGQKVRSALLNPEKANPFNGELAKRFANAGGRVSMDRDYRGTQAKSFYDAAVDRHLKEEFKRQAGQIGLSLKGAAAAARVAGNVLTSISAPLFKEVIPRLKMGAWADMMEGYMKANPKASEAQLNAAASKYLDSVDNRFGEMNRNNMFWRRTTQQVANGLLLSPTWKIGSWREIGGGIIDIPESVRGIAKGEGISPRTAYLMAMGVTVPLINGLYTYFKTGTAPHGMDFAAGRTGGTDPRTSTPERLLVPGNQKEVYAALNALDSIKSGGPIDYALSGANPAVSAPAEAAFNTDRMGTGGKPVYGPQSADGDFGRWVEGQADPISLEMQKQRLKGSHVGTFETILGGRTAPTYLEQDGKVPGWLQKYNKRMSKMAKRREARRERRYQ